MRRVLLCCNLFWILFSVITCIEAYRLKLGGVTKPGSGFFPFSAGLVMLVLAMVALVQLIRQKKEERELGGREGARWWNIAMILAAVGAFAFTLERIGFLISTFLFITLLLKVIEPQSWKASILGGVISAVAANLLFNVIFKAQIPTGILGF
jgi:putative tricarboxylic transport membrane protein